MRNCSTASTSSQKICTFFCPPIQHDPTVERAMCAKLRPDRYREGQGWRERPFFRKMAPQILTTIPLTPGPSRSGSALDCPPRIGRMPTKISVSFIRAIYGGRVRLGNLDAGRRSSLNLFPSPPLFLLSPLCPDRHLPRIAAGWCCQARGHHNGFVVPIHFRLA